MRPAGPLAVGFLVLSANLCVDQAKAGWASELADALEQVVPMLFRSAGKVASEDIIVGEEFLRNSTKAEKKEVENAVAGMSKYSGRGLQAKHLEDIKAASFILKNAPNEFDRTIPLSDKYPFFQIRAHRSPDYDVALVSFARSRLEAQLADRFDVNDLKVVGLAMSDDPDRSASEVARLNRYVGSRFVDRVGPLARLGSLADISSPPAQVAALEPYRGRTIVLVGHIPDATEQFFVFGDGGPRPIPIGDWMSAADEAGVNLIPIGCNSEKLAQLGAKGIINSSVVIERLQEVVNNRPVTVGEFFATLTSRDLTLVFDPLETRLFSNGAQIVARETNDVVGRVIVQGARIAAPRLQDYIRSVSGTASSFEPCFLSTGGDAFDRCANEVKAAAILEARRIAALDEAGSRQRRRSEAPGEMKALELRLSAQGRAWFGFSLFYVLVWLTGFFLVFHGYFSARLLEKESGPSWRAIFGRTSIRQGVAMARSVVSRPSAHPLAVAFLVIPLLTGVLVLFAYPLNGRLTITVFFIGLLGMVRAVVTLRDAVQERSLALGVVVLAFLAWAGAACLQVDSADKYDALRERHATIAKELIDLKAREQEDAVMLNTPRRSECCRSRTSAPDPA